MLPPLVFPGSRHKQGRKADKAVRPACFVRASYTIACSSIFLTSIYTLSNLLFLDIYGNHGQTLRAKSGPSFQL
jgi:hypothetical protein